MYDEFFGFRDKPFSLRPDARLFFADAARAAGERQLSEAIRRGGAAAAIIGPPGSGKTILAKRLIAGLGPAVRHVFIQSSGLTFDNLVIFTARKLGLELPPGGAEARLDALRGFLESERARSRTTVLFVDEAQNLRADVFEGLPRLFGGDGRGAQLLQVVLIGQPDLDVQLDHPAAADLASRLVARIRLAPFAAVDVAGYIESRLRAAGAMAREVFTGAAVEAIARRSDGLPRAINAIADRALFAGFARQEKPVSASLVEEAARELSLTRGEGMRSVTALAGAAPASIPVERRTASPAESPVKSQAEPPIRPRGESEARQRAQLLAHRNPAGNAPERRHGGGRIWLTAAAVVLALGGALMLFIEDARLTGLGAVAAGLRASAEVAEAQNRRVVAERDRLKIALDEARAELAAVSDSAMAGQTRDRALTRELEAARVRLAELAAETTALQGRLRQAMGAAAQGRDRAETAERESARLAGELERARTALDAAAAARRRLQDAVKADRAEAAGLARALAAAHTRQAELEAELEAEARDLNARLWAAADAAEQSMAQTATAAREAARLGDALARNEAVLAEATAARRRAEARAAELAGERDRLAAGLTTRDADYVGLSAALEDAHRELATVGLSRADDRAEIERLRAALTDAEGSLASLRQAQEEDRATLAGLQTERDELATRLTGYAEQLAAQRALVAGVAAQRQQDGPADRMAAVTVLLGQADRFMQQERLTIPAGGSAFDNYREVLKLDPDNRAAWDGLGRIIQRYRDWATQRERRGDWSVAERYYQRGLKVDPTDTRLREGLDRVRRAVGKPAADAATGKGRRDVVKILRKIDG